MRRALPHPENTSEIHTFYILHLGLFETFDEKQNRDLNLKIRIFRAFSRVYCRQAEIEKTGKLIRDPGTRFDSFGRTGLYIRFNFGLPPD